MNTAIVTLNNNSIIEMNDQEISHVFGGGFWADVVDTAKDLAAKAEEFGEKMGGKLYKALN